MIIFLYGSDAYRRHQKSKEIIEEYKKRHPNFVLQFFNFEEEGEFLKLQEFSQNRSFFEEIKMAVLENVFAAAEEKLKDFLKNSIQQKDLILLILEDNLPPKEFEFLLEKPIQFQEFPDLNIDQLKFFINKEAKKRNINLTDRAIQFLGDAFQKNTWGLVTELDKLALIPKSKLDVPDLKEYADIDLSYSEQNAQYIGRTARYNIFDFINNLNTKYLAQNLDSLERLFLYHEEPSKIFNLLAASRRKTKNLTEKLARYDILVKLGRLDYEEALLDLALSF